MKCCDAFYLSSDLKYRVEFEFLFHIQNFYEREGFEKLMEEFSNHVKFFGTVNPFHDEIIKMLDDEGLDRLLLDTELMPELTFFIKLDSNEMFYSKETCELYKLRGANTKMNTRDMLDGRVIKMVVG